MKSPFLPAIAATFMLTHGGPDFGLYNRRLADELRRPYVGKRKPSGTDRDKVKAARKQNRTRRK